MIKNVKEITNRVFEIIENAKSKDEILAIYTEVEILVKNKMDDHKYPKIEFKITNEDLQSLPNGSALDFSKEISKFLNDPISKLLYATLWKNGDLQKIKHIVKGIRNSGEENDEQEDALVFYQFGKYLTKTPGQPIIDQHVIRAFAVYKPEKSDTIEKICKMDTLNKKYHKEYIKNYKKWLSDLGKDEEFNYEVDKVLFALGKTIKA